MLMDGAPGSQALVHQMQLVWPLMSWNSTSVDAKNLQNAGCWQHHESLLKGVVELLKLLLKPSRLPLELPRCGFSEMFEELIFVGVLFLGFTVLCWCGRSGACAVPYLELC
ncbi:hypothetical protein Nepgr_031746 [Nepenthes gracilis]|uniref:Uncharacterized protein n=1 Tax=Nepenthes gracilis TaxID=150966 RepID=A0AAD3TJ22_NEPGR|nr:hypothetical protein Nepgr_031746 [Nepenthes gracilis]